MSKMGKAKSAMVIKSAAPAAQEQEFLNNAVEFINGQVQAASGSIIEIGKYLLKNFFNGDVDKAHDRGPRKGISLRKLADHPDILMSFPQLSRAVCLAVQEKLLGSVATSKHLTASHKVLLVAIGGHADLAAADLLALKRKYITQIEKDTLSVRAFHNLLIHDGYSKPRGLAAIEDKSERRLLRSGYHKFLDPFESIADLDVDRLLELPKDRIKSVYTEARKAMDNISKILKRLEQVVG